MPFTFTHKLVIVKLILTYDSIKIIYLQVLIENKMKKIINQETISLIKNFEGLNTSKYICPAGKATIGYGHVILKNEKLDNITEAQAENLLFQDLRKFANYVHYLIKAPLNSNQFGALVSFCFNVGSKALQRSTLRQKLNRLEYEDAAREFNKWIYVRGSKIKGLILRRKAEKLLFLS